MPGLWRTRGEVAPIWPGSNHDLGSTWSEESTNFAVWAPEASAAYLCLIALFFVIINLIVDLLYAVFDPRIRYA